MRHQFDTPDGLFPQNYPEPDEPDEANYESHLLAALVMDDYDNQVPSDQKEESWRPRSYLECKGPSWKQLSPSLRNVGRTLNVQANERFAHHVPSEVQRVREAREVLLRVAPTEADVLAEVSAPAFSGPPHKLEVETRNESASAASTAEVPATTESPVTKAMPKSPPTNILPPQPIPQSTSQPSSIPDQPSFNMRMGEPEWLETQVALLRDGPTLWFSPREYGASQESTPSVPVLPTIPQEVLAQEVDLSNFPTYAEWQEAMWSAPF
eukprot:3801646-Amphidinium_carterae.2